MDTLDPEEAPNPESLEALPEEIEQLVKRRRQTSELADLSERAFDAAIPAKTLEEANGLILGLKARIDDLVIGLGITSRQLAFEGHVVLTLTKRLNELSERLDDLDDRGERDAQDDDPPPFRGRPRFSRN
jgi:hypothetical protein